MRKALRVKQFKLPSCARVPIHLWKLSVVSQHVQTSHSLATKQPSELQGKPLKDTVHLSRFRSVQNSKTSLSQSGTTIYALSTAPGRAAIAVIRISGPACTQIYHQLCPNAPLPHPRSAVLRTLHEPHEPPSRDTILDTALIIHFPSPNTVTGEDVLELHLHGGPAIIKAVLAAIPRCWTASLAETSKLGSQGSIRYAEPGEFTRRAFDNGRLDLTQIEALGDALTASTEQQRRLSVRGTTSTLAKRYDSWRERLLYARGELEALIDFSEDQHFDESPAVLAASVARQVAALKKQIDNSIENAVRGELLRKGIEVALLGAPNAGKSSLLNRIVGREAAIVSREEGTTRDIVEVGVDIGGFYVRLGDMAGLRKSKGYQGTVGLNTTIPGADVVSDVEQEGIRRAKVRALESDLVIVVLSVEESPDGQEAGLRLDSEVIETASQCLEKNKDIVVVINKMDKIASVSDHTASVKAWTRAIREALPALPMDRIFYISCIEADSRGIGLGTGSKNPSGLQASGTPQKAQPSLKDTGNIQSFLKGLVAVFQEMTQAAAPEVGDVTPDASIWEESLGATERQRLLLDECAGHLDAFLGQVVTASIHESGAKDGIDEDGIDIVVAAESLRAAADCLAKITGKGMAGDVEEVLGVVFEK